MTQGVEMPPVEVMIAAIQAEIDAPLTGPTHGAWDRGRIGGLRDAVKIVRAAARHTHTAATRSVRVELPADIAEHVLRIGRVEWGQTHAHDAEGHGAHVAESVRKTATHFGQEGDQHMHGLWLEGTETVLCHTGTSPNAPKTTQALVGAWNWLVDLAAAPTPDAAAATVTENANVAAVPAEECPECERRVLIGNPSATGFLATCGRRLASIDECRPCGCAAPKVASDTDAAASEAGEVLPQHIGRLHLGEHRSDGERLCSHGHPVAVGQALYWPQEVNQYDDSDPLCLEHAIEQAVDDNGWCECDARAALTTQGGAEG